MAIKILKTVDKWVKAEDGDGDAEFLVVPINYRAHRAAIKKVAGTAEDERWLHYCELVSPKILIDWRGIIDEKGDKVDFDIDMAMDGLSDRVWATLIGEAMKEVNESEETFQRSAKANKVAKNKSKRVQRRDRKST